MKNTNQVRIRALTAVDVPYMKNSEPSSTMNRREFMKSMVMVAGTAMTSFPLVSLAGNPIRIGVLLPESRIYPDLGKNWLAGARLALKRADKGACRRIVLIPQSTGFTTGATARRIKVFLEDGVKLVTGMISPGLAVGLQDHFTENRAFLLMSSLGANVSTPAIDSPFIFRHTLNTWQAAWSLGNWAARTLGRRAMIISSFYESGFDSLRAFSLGFEGGKGRILESIVTDKPIAERDLLESALCNIRYRRPDVVYAAYCGPAASDFFRAYDEAGLTGKVALLGTGMLTDEYFLGARCRAALDIRTGFAWSREMHSPGSISFAAAFRRPTGRTADPFALLGYETVLLILNALKSRGANPQNAKAFTRALSRVEVHSPRGRLCMDPASRTTFGPVYAFRVRSDGMGLRSEVVTRLGCLAELDKRVEKLRSGTRSGWINMYLTV